MISVTPGKNREKMELKKEAKISEMMERKENKLSASELDKTLKLPDNTIENIENCKTVLSKDVLDKLSDFFKVQKDYILGKTSEKYKGEIDDLEIDLKNAMDKIRRISPDDRKKLLQILDIFDSKKDNWNLRKEW